MQIFWQENLSTIYKSYPKQNRKSLIYSLLQFLKCWKVFQNKKSPFHFGFPLCFTFHAFKKPYKPSKFLQKYTFICVYKIFLLLYLARVSYWTANHKRRPSSRLRMQPTGRIGNWNKCSNPASRAYPSYVYLNYVQVGSTRGSDIETVEGHFGTGADEAPMSVRRGSPFGSNGIERSFSWDDEVAQFRIDHSREGGTKVG